MTTSTTHPDLAIRAQGLRKRYGEAEALSGVSLDVPRGSVYGVLGPNGAGKTTLVRILATLIHPDGGRASVLGHDVEQDPAGIREQISLTGQFASVDEDLTATENLVLLARLLGLPAGQARARAAALLSAFGLAEAAGRRTATFSGGMRRRLDIAASLITVPRVLFLDEPTTGLDPRSRNQVWEVIRHLVARGTTVVLTTQYLDEADRLADRIAVIDHGEVIAEGTRADLKASVGAGHVRVRLGDPGQAAAAAAVLEQALGSPALEGPEPAELVIRTDQDTEHVPAAMAAVLDRLAGSGIRVSDFAFGQPSLDEVFLTLTGHAPTEVSQATTEPGADTNVDTAVIREEGTR